MISRSDIEMSFFSFLFYGINIRGVSILYKKKKKEKENRKIRMKIDRSFFVIKKKTCE